MERIYIITYDVYFSAGGTFKYALKPKSEKRKLFYYKSEREEFIKKYNELKLIMEKDIYIDTLECFTAVPEKIDDMIKIIEAI